jgi:hypothetical protein
VDPANKAHVRGSMAGGSESGALDERGAHDYWGRGMHPVRPEAGPSHSPHTSPPSPPIPPIPTPHPHPHGPARLLPTGMAGSMAGGTAGSSEVDALNLSARFEDRLLSAGGARGRRRAIARAIAPPLPAVSCRRSGFAQPSRRARSHRVWGGGARWEEGAGNNNNTRNEGANAPSLVRTR